MTSHKFGQLLTPPPPSSCVLLLRPCALELLSQNHWPPSPRDRDVIYGRPLSTIDARVLKAQSSLGGAGVQTHNQEITRTVSFISSPIDNPILIWYFTINNKKKWLECVYCQMSGDKKMVFKEGESNCEKRRRESWNDNENIVLKLNSHSHRRLSVRPLHFF